MKITLFLIVPVALAAFLIGRASGPSNVVRADSSGSPLIQVQPIRGDSSLTIYYPGLNKLFVYQTPFVGLPSWSCSYSIQLSEPGGKIDRQPCPSPGQAF